MMTFAQRYLQQRGSTRGLDAKRKLRAIEWAVFYTAGDLLAEAGVRDTEVGRQVNLMLYQDAPRLRCLDTLHRFVQRVERQRDRIEGLPDVEATAEEVSASEAAAYEAFADLSGELQDAGLWQVDPEYYGRRAYPGPFSGHDG